jgi:hypothetical protein
MDSKADRRERVLSWVGVVLIWLAVLSCIGGVAFGLAVVSALDAREPGRPVVTPAPYPGPRG